MNSIRALLSNITKSNFHTLDIVEVQCNKSISDMKVYWDLPQLKSGVGYRQEDFDRVEKKLNSGKFYWTLVRHFSTRLNSRRFVTFKFQRKSRERYENEKKLREFGGLSEQEFERMAVLQRKQQLDDKSVLNNEAIQDRYDKYVDDILK